MGIYGEKLLPLVAWLGLLLLCHPQYVLSQYSWLYLAVSGGSTPIPNSEEMFRSSEIRLESRPDRSSIYHPGCDRLIGLNAIQRQICSQQPGAMPSVSFGARSAIVECRYQFKYERWNCTTKKTDNDTSVDIFGATLRAANKESAFISAITSASVVHSITKACSAGNLTYCGCDNSVGLKYMGNDRNAFPTVTSGLQSASEATDGKWSWGGCSDNVRYGVKFSKQFLDRSEKEGFRKLKDTRHLMNLHNHNAGREAVLRYMKKHCRCHGVSGSCEFKTCWMSMPKFSQVGTVIKAWYDRYHVQVAKRSKKRLRRKERSERKIPVRPNELVYINRSPNYCIRDENMGILGTHGRECNKTSYGSDSCDLLCCGRGYNTKVVEKEEMCLCKFVWCCHVKCKTCKTVIDVHTCK